MEVFPSWLASFPTLTSSSWGICDDQGQWDSTLVPGRNPYPSGEDLDRLTNLKIRGIYKPTGILPGQSKDVMVEYIERKTLSEGPFEIGSEEVVSPLVEIPSMIKLNAWQLGKLVRVFSGAESVVGGGCGDDERTNRANNELVVPAGDGIQDAGAEEGHGAIRKEEWRDIAFCC